MSKNATSSSSSPQVVLCGDLNLVAMVCCIVLSVVNLLMLVLFIALAAYVLNYRRRRRTPPAAAPPNRPPEVHPNPAYVNEETPREPRRPRRANSSLSSAGLCEVLFPPKHEGEVIISATPTHPRRVRAVAGRVYATPRGGRRLLRRSAPHVASMEWDYFEPAATAVSSNADSDRRNAVNICWV